MRKYVLGFLFSQDRKVVLLTLKHHPEWQAGKLNGIGGHIENNESADAAMDREAFEEIGVRGAPWQPFATLNGPDWRCYVYRAFGDLYDRLWPTKNDAGEELIIAQVDTLGRFPTLPVLTNLRWLIPFVLDEGNLQHGRPFYINVEYEQ